MAYFQWANDMSIDQGPIDADHKHLVDLVNELHTATSEGQGQAVVGRILDELIQYTVDHLRREEARMGFHNVSPIFARPAVGEPSGRFMTVSMRW